MTKTVGSQPIVSISRHLCLLGESIVDYLLHASSEIINRLSFDRKLDILSSKCQHLITHSINCNNWQLTLGHHTKTFSAFEKQQYVA